MNVEGERMLIMGLNCGGWPKNTVHNIIDRIWSVLDKNKPDIVWILESALTETEKARTFHDKY